MTVEQINRLITEMTETSMQTLGRIKEGRQKQNDPDALQVIVSGLHLLTELRVALDRVDTHDRGY